MVALDIMKRDVKDWTSRWFHMNYFIPEYLFSKILAEFKSRAVKLSIDIYIMSL